MGLGRLLFASFCVAGFGGVLFGGCIFCERLPGRLELYGGTLQMLILMGHRSVPLVFCENCCKCTGTDLRCG